MALQVTCACGFVFRADDADRLWGKAQLHLADAHPDQIGLVTQEDIVAQAELV